jgi:hypothetical protein
MNDGPTDAHYDFAAKVCGFDPRDAIQPIDPNAGPPNRSVDPNAGQPNQSVDPNAGQPNQSVDPNAGQPNQSVDPNAGQPNQSVGPNAGQPNQSVDPNAGQPNQSVDPNAGQPKQSVDPNAGQPNQSVDPNAGQPKQSVDPNAGTTVQPPVSGAQSGTNPYARTQWADVWKQGFDDGFAEPDASHPAPAPIAGDAATIYSEGVLAGQQAAHQPTPNQSVQDPNTTQPSDNKPDPSQSAPEDNSTGARFIKVFGLVGDKLGPGIAEKLKQINVAEVIAFTAVFILVEDTPLGWAAMVAGAVMIGKEIIDVIEDVTAFISMTVDPNGDLDAAAKHLVDALGKIAVDALIIWLTHKAGSAAKPYMKPPPGMVDVLTPEGVIMRIPADKIPDNSMMSEGSGDGAGTGKTGQPGADDTSGRDNQSSQDNQSRADNQSSQDNQSRADNQSSQDNQSRADNQSSQDNQSRADNQSSQDNQSRADNQSSQDNQSRADNQSSQDNQSRADNQSSQDNQSRADNQSSQDNQSRADNQSSRDNQSRADNQSSQDNQSRADNQSSQDNQSRADNQSSQDNQSRADNQSSQDNQSRADNQSSQDNQSKDDTRTPEDHEKGGTERMSNPNKGNLDKWMSILKIGKEYRQAFGDYLDRIHDDGEIWDIIKRPAEKRTVDHPHLEDMSRAERKRLVDRFWEEKPYRDDE